MRTDLGSRVIGRTVSLQQAAASLVHAHSVKKSAPRDCRRAGLPLLIGPGGSSAEPRVRPTLTVMRGSGEGRFQILEPFRDQCRSRHQPAPPSPHRHPRAGGDPGRLTTGVSGDCPPGSPQGACPRAHLRCGVTWIPACAGMTPQATPPRLPRHQPAPPSPHRHPRAGGDPGHLTTGGIRRLPAGLAARCLPESAPAMRGVLGSRLRGNDAASYPSAPATPPAGASLPTPSSPRRRGPRSPHNRGHPATARRARRKVPARERTCDAGRPGFPPSRE